MSVLLKMKTMMVKIKARLLNLLLNLPMLLLLTRRPKTTCLPAPTFGMGYKDSSKNKAFSVSRFASSALVASDASHRNTFFFDSGASVHLTHQKELLHDFIPGQFGSIAGLDPATPFQVCGTGTLNFMLPDGSLC